MGNGRRHPGSGTLSQIDQTWRITMSNINKLIAGFHIVFFAVVFLALNHRIDAQNDPSLLEISNFLAGEVSPQTPIPKDMGNQENLDLYSGKLKTVIPLFSLKGRGETAINISNIIQAESMSGYFYTSCCPAAFSGPITSIYTSSFRTYYNNLLKFGAGYGPGVVYTNWSSFTSPVNSQGIGVNWPSLPRRPVNLTFVGPNGMVVTLRDAEIIREVKYSNQGVYVGNAHQYRNINEAGKVYLSTDDNGTRFTSDTILTVPGGGTGSFWADINNEAFGVPVLPTGWLDFSNGTRYRVESGYVVSARDRNGNTIVYEYETMPPPGSGYPSLKRLTRIIDSLNREVTIAYGNYSVPDQINYKGVSGGNRTIKVQKKSLGEALYSGFQLATLKDLFRDPITGAYHWHTISYPSSALYNPEVISSIEYADGRMMTFQYTNYGELACVRKPTGAKSIYQYGSGFQNASSGGLLSADNFYNQNPPEGARSTSWLLYRRVLEVQNYLDETTLVNRIAISRPEILTFTPLSDCAIYKEVYDASGVLISKKKHRFYENFQRQNFQVVGMAASQLSRWVAGLEYEVATYTLSGSETVIYKYDEKSWTHGPFGVTPGTGHYTWWDGDIFKLWLADRPRVVSEKTSNTENSLFSQNTFSYDEYLNVTDVNEYDTGTLKRKTHIDYLRVNPVTGVDYRHLWGLLLKLPLRKLIYDSDGVSLKARVEYEYDNYANDGNHAPLLDRSNINQLCIHFLGAVCSGPAPSTFLERGNLTSETVFADATNGGGAISVYKKYDVAGNPISTKDGLGNISQVDFTDSFADGLTRPFQTFAFATQNTSPIPDPSGQKGTNQSLVTKGTYDYDTGLVISTKDENNQVTTSSYAKPDGSADPLDRLQKTTFADGGWVAYEYGDTPGNIYVRTRTLRDADPTLKVAEAYQYYDNLLRATRSYTLDPTTPLNWVGTEIKYDALNRSWKTSNAVRVQTPGTAISNPEWTTTTYDFMGRPIEVTTPDGAKTITAYFGRKVMATDQARKTRLTELDGLGRLVNVTEFNRQVPSPYILEQPSSNDFASHYEYNVLDNLTKVTLTSQTNTQIREFSFDSLGRLTSASNPESGTATYTYDNNNNLKTKTDARNIRTEFDHDKLNRIVQRRYVPVGTPPANYTQTPTVDFYYDGTGMPSGIPSPSFSLKRLTATKSSVGETITTRLDIIGRILAQSQIVDPQSASPHVFSMEYTYDLSGSVKTAKYPSGKVISNQYDAAGKLSGTRNLNGDFYCGSGPNGVNRVKYTPFGSVEALHLGNGKWEHSVYNSRLRPVEMGLGNTSTDSSIFKLEYKYGVRVNNQNDLTQDNGNIERQIITVPGVASFTQNYTYDNLNRLDSAKEIKNEANEIWRQGFIYDRFGNRSVDQDPGRTSTALLGNPVNINQSNNRISSSGFIYDTSGNLVQMPDSGNTINFEYDGENKQSVYKINQTQQAVYFYDGDGRRVKKVVGTGAGAQITIYVYNIVGQLITEYSNQSVNTGNIGYTTPDHLGSTRIVSNKDGSVRSRHDYLPFGEEIVSTLTSNGRETIPTYNLGNINQKFTGQERDTESGLDFFKSRFYSSDLGRFLSPDEFPGGASAFFTSAASAKPTFYADPTDPQTFNKYQYGYNNPLRFIDPDGHRGRPNNGHQDRSSSGYWESIYSTLTDMLTTQPSPASGAQVTEVQAFLLYSEMFGKSFDKYLEVMESVGADLGARQLSKEAMENSGTQGVKDPIGATLAIGNSVVQVLSLGIGGQALGAVEGGATRLTKSIGTTIASGSDEAIEAATTVRQISKGEKWGDLTQEIAQRTYESGGREHAIISLKDGNRLIVQGGPGGMNFPGYDLKRVIAHTHPTSTGPSQIDFDMLKDLNQASSYIREGGATNKFWQKR